MTVTVTVPRKALQDVVEYLYHNEEKDWMECGKPDNHIFLSVEALMEALNDEEK